MSGSAAGALHRGWINLKSALTSGDDHAILAECERGEDSAVEEVSKALDNGLSAPVQEGFVSRQYPPRSNRRMIVLSICATLPKKTDELQRNLPHPEAPIQQTVASGETLLLCQKKKHLNARAKTSARANRLLLRRASLCAKRWNIFGKANTVPARRSRQSPLVSPRRVERESDCRLRSAARNEQNVRPNVIWQRAAPAVERSLLRDGPAQRNVRSNAKAVGQRRSRPCRDTRSASPGNALDDHDQPRPGKPHARDRAAAEMLS